MISTSDWLLIRLSRPFAETFEATSPESNNEGAEPIELFPDMIVPNANYLKYD